MDLKDLIAAVKRHAHANYDKDGWDIVAECWGDGEYNEFLKGCKTEAGAIRKVTAVIHPKAAYRAEIEAEAF